MDRKCFLGTLGAFAKDDGVIEGCNDSKITIDEIKKVG